MSAEGLCADVHGHAPARAYFERALGRGRVAHAYLLVGAEGTGKRRFAEGLAAALLCHRRTDESGPCGACASCRTLASGNHPGYTLLSPEPGKSVEISRIRELIAAFSVRTTERRVAIIDPADRMQEAAASALLKTLEEPPPGVVFLLVTSRPAQLLSTIHSRCHRVPFAGLDETEFSAVLTEQGVDPADFPGLHSAVGGSPGRALRLVEGIEGCGGEERFEALLAGVGSDRPETLTDFVPARPDEGKRDRVRRLLVLVLDGLWSRRGETVEEREACARRALEVAQLRRDLDGFLNVDLIVERLARILRG